MAANVHKHDYLLCPRCGTGHECKVGSINLCHCTAVPLTEEQRQYVNDRFDGCLCTNCLTELRAEYDAKTHVAYQDGY